MRKQKSLRYNDLNLSKVKSACVGGGIIPGIPTEGNGIWFEKNNL